MKKYLILIIALLGLNISLSAAETAQQALDKCVARLKSACGVSADFTLSRQGKSFSGKIKEKGSKFSILSSAFSTWYDGKCLATWSPDSNEVTFVSPSAEELAETNPLQLLQSAGAYSVSYGASKGSATKVLVLTPKRRGVSAKKVVVTLASASLTPQRLDITMADGKAVTVTLRNVSLKAQLSDADFRFPKSKYPKAKIVDLR